MFHRSRMFLSGLLSVPLLFLPGCRLLLLAMTCARPLGVGRLVLLGRSGLRAVFEMGEMVRLFPFYPVGLFLESLVGWSPWVLDRWVCRGVPCCGCPFLLRFPGVGFFSQFYWLPCPFLGVFLVGRVSVFGHGCAPSSLL